MRHERTCVSVKKMNPPMIADQPHAVERIADRRVQRGGERGRQIDDVRGLETRRGQPRRHGVEERVQPAGLRIDEREQEVAPREPPRGLLVGIDGALLEAIAQSLRRRRVRGMQERAAAARGDLLDSFRVFMPLVEVQIAGEEHARLALEHLLFEETRARQLFVARVAADRRPRGSSAARARRRSGARHRPCARRPSGSTAPAARRDPRRAAGRWPAATSWRAV